MAVFLFTDLRMTNSYGIGEWEHIIISNIKRLIPESVKSTWHEWRVSVKQAEREMTGKEAVTEHVEMAGWGVEEAQERNKKDASESSYLLIECLIPFPSVSGRQTETWNLGLATQLALAYAIHKTFIFIRVPLTAAITPKVVKVLRGWGWDIGKRTTKEAKAIKRAAAPSKR